VKRRGIPAGTTEAPGKPDLQPVVAGAGIDFIGGIRVAKHDARPMCSRRHVDSVTEIDERRGLGHSGI
jgi:hypothetical protein